MSVKEKKPMGVSQWKEYGKRYGYWDYFKKEILKEERDGVQHNLQKYNELIMAVESKCDGETRHETALRIIRNSQKSIGIGKKV